MANKIFRICALLLFLTVSAFAESRFFVSNKNFFMIQEISESRRKNFEFVLILTRNGETEEGQLFKNGDLVGELLRRFDNRDLLVLEERFARDKELIERIRFRYYPDGRPRMALRELPDGTAYQFTFAERSDGGFDYYQVDDTYERIRVQTDEFASTLFRESQKDNVFTERERITRDSDASSRVEHSFANGRKRIELRYNEMPLSIEEYNEDVLVQRTRYTYSSEGLLLSRTTERADANEQILYTYVDGIVLREEFYQEDQIMWTIDYSENNARTLTRYRNGDVFIVEQFSGEEKTDVEIVPLSTTTP